MTYKVYSIRDVKTGFASPFVDVSDDAAIRGFNFAFNNNTNLINFSPSDFCLYRIGYFDSDSGCLTDELPVPICDASAFKKVSDSFAE